MHGLHGCLCNNGAALGIAADLVCACALAHAHRLMTWDLGLMPQGMLKVCLQKQLLFKRAVLRDHLHRKLIGTSADLKHVSLVAFFISLLSAL